MNRQDKEDWKPIGNYENYEVSNYGRVKRKGNTTKCHHERFLKPCSVHEYLYVSLCKNGKAKRFAIHRLVCDAFYGKQPDLDVNHRDGDKSNNHLYNLEWVTRSQNMRHAVDTGLRTYPTGKNHWSSKLSEDDVWMIRATYILCGDSVSRKQMAQHCGVSVTTITEVLNYHVYPDVICKL